MKCIQLADIRAFLGTCIPYITNMVSVSVLTVLVLQHCPSLASCPKRELLAFVKHVFYRTVSENLPLLHSHCAQTAVLGTHFSQLESTQILPHDQRLSLGNIFLFKSFSDPFFSLVNSISASHITVGSLLLQFMNFRLKLQPSQHNDLLSTSVCKLQYSNGTVNAFGFYLAVFVSLYHYNALTYYSNYNLTETNNKIRLTRKRN